MTLLYQNFSLHGSGKNISLVMQNANLLYWYDAQTDRQCSRSPTCVHSLNCRRLVRLGCSVWETNNHKVELWVLRWTRGTQQIESRSLLLIYLIPFLAVKENQIKNSNIWENNLTTSFIRLFWSFRSYCMVFISRWRFYEVSQIPEVCVLLNS